MGSDGGCASDQAQDRDAAPALARLGQVELDAESPREAYFQTLVSRGDRRVGGILERLEAAGCETSGAIWHELSKIHREVEAGENSSLPDPDFFVTRHYAHDEVLPWDFIDHHIHKWFLLSERKKAHYEHQTAVRRRAMHCLRRLLE